MHNMDESKGLLHCHSRREVPPLALKWEVPPPVLDDTKLLRRCREEAAGESNEILVKVLGPCWVSMSCQDWSNSATNWSSRRKTSGCSASTAARSSAHPAPLPLTVTVYTMSSWSLRLANSEMARSPLTCSRSGNSSASRRAGGGALSRMSNCGRQQQHHVCV